MFLAPSLAIFYLGIGQFLEDKRQYRGMLNSVRKDVPIWRVLLGIALFFGFTYVQVPLLKQEVIPLCYTFIATIGIFISTYYAKHSNSLRAFEDGLMLPGKESELIPWNEIHAIHIEGDIVTFSLADQPKTIEIDRRDSKDMIAIVEIWKQRSLRVQ